MNRLNQPEPSKAQLRNYLCRKREKESLPVISFGDLANILDTHSVPTGPDEAYVVSKILTSDIDTDEKSFRFFVSSPRLLNFAPAIKSVHADETYKLIWEGWFSYDFIIICITLLNGFSFV